MGLSQKRLQLLVSAVGTLLIVPWGLVLGAMFTFAFRAGESRWAWGFDIVSFWLQIPAIIVSFFRPRIAAWWMLANVSASVLMGMWFEIQSFYNPDARHLVVSEWISTLLPLLKTCMWFWGLPTLFAVLLLVTGRYRLNLKVEE
jgi:hypothetical protein